MTSQADPKPLGRQVIGDSGLSVQNAEECYAGLQEGVRSVYSLPWLPRWVRRIDTKPQAPAPARPTPQVEEPRHGAGDYVDRGGRWWVTWTARTFAVDPCMRPISRFSGAPRKISAL